MDSALVEKVRRLALACLAALAALLLQSLGSGVWAVSGQCDLRRTIPPRPPTSTPVHLPTATPAGKRAASIPTGAYIVLQADGVDPGVWAMVQWADAQGDWHDVTGWQGDLDDGHRKTWWVHPRDFGTGPFRWIVLQERGGSILGASASFYLPSAARERVRVGVALVP